MQDDEVEADDMANAIFEELQLGAVEGVPPAPTGPVAQAAALEPEAEDADVVRFTTLVCSPATARASDRRAYVRSPPRLRSLMVAWWRQDQMMARLAALKA